MSAPWNQAAVAARLSEPVIAYGAADIAPLNRTVDQLSGEVVTAEGLRTANDRLVRLALARAQCEATEAREETARVMIELQRLGEALASLATFANRMHTERDNATEDAEILRHKLEQVRDERDEALTRLQEFEQELAETVQWLTKPAGVSR